MKKNKGYVAFKGENKLETGKIYEGNFTVFPTLEDSLKGAPIDDEKTIAQVEALNITGILDSKYYGYYNMMNTEGIKILKVLSYKEIIDEMSSNSKSEFAKIRFLQGYRVNPEDLDKFTDSFGVWQAVEYFQKGNTKIYNQKINDSIEEYEKTNSGIKVMKYGKHSN